LPFPPENYYIFVAFTEDFPLLGSALHGEKARYNYLLQTRTMSDETIRIRILEEKFAHQEKLVDALNEVIIEQQSRLQILEDHFQSLRVLLQTLQSDQAPGSPEPPPPHY